MRRIASQAPVWLSLGWSLHVYWTWGKYQPATLPVVLLAHLLALLGIWPAEARPLRALAGSAVILLFAIRAGYYFGLALLPSMILLWLSGLLTAAEASEPQKRRAWLAAGLAAILFGLYVGGYVHLTRQSRPHFEDARSSSAVLKVRGNLVK